MIDEITRRDRVNITPTGFIYFHTIMDNRFSFSDNSANLFSDQTANNLCNAPDTRDSALTYKYMYQDIEGHKLLEVSVDTSLCGVDTASSYILTK